MTFIYLSWAVYIGGLAFWVLRGNYPIAVFWLIGVPVVQWAYIVAFPAISRYIGYGRVDDHPASATGKSPTTVTLYTALGCPFCPILKRRLVALQAEMGFDLQEVDVTLKPDLLTSKGIRAVPVVEAGGQQLVGHATSEQLAALIRKAASS